MIDTWKQGHPAFADGAPRDALGDVRARALARFEETGFPGSRDEDWKYTSTRKIAGEPFVHAQLDAPADVLDAARIEHAVAELVFVDGRFSAELSRAGEADGLTVRRLAEALDDEGVRGRVNGLAAWHDEPFTALNTAFLQDGVVVETAKNADVGIVHVIAVSRADEAPVVSHLRHLLRAATGSRVTLVETFVGAEGPATLTNVVDEVEVEANAEVRHQIVGLTPSSAHLVHTLEVRAARDARYRGHLSWLGGAITRSNVRATLVEPGAEVHVDGLFVLDGQEHVDNHTVIDHAAPRCISREFYKGVLSGSSRGVFDGRVVVREDAQQTDSSQDSRNLLLSDKADANAKPQLEIYADDVKCSHGTTVGQLEHEQLWYLRSRGIPEDDARAMLTAAFVADRVERLPDEALRERLRAFVDDKLARVQEEA